MTNTAFTTSGLADGVWATGNTHLARVHVTFVSPGGHILFDALTRRRKWCCYFSFVLFKLILNETNVFDLVCKHWARTKWSSGIVYVDFTRMTGFCFPYTNQLTVLLIPGLSVCDNCIWILNALWSWTWFVTVFAYVVLCLESRWYVKIVKRLVLHQQALPFNS